MFLVTDTGISRAGHVATAKNLLETAGIGVQVFDQARENPTESDAARCRDAALGFSFDLEDNGGFNRGWYNESSVHSVLYDLYDDRSDGVDGTSLGFAPIYETLTTALAETVALTSIFSFAVPLKDANPDEASAIDALLEGQDIVGVDMEHIVVLFDLEFRQRPRV